MMVKELRRDDKSGDILLGLQKIIISTIVLASKN